MIETILASALHIYTSLYLCLILSERKKSQFSMIFFSFSITFLVMLITLTKLIFLSNLIIILGLYLYVFKDTGYIGINKRLFYSVISVLSVSFISYIIYSVLFYIPVSFPFHLLAILITFFIIFFATTVLTVVNYLKAFSYSSLLSLIGAAIFLFVSFRNEISPSLQVETITNKLTLSLAFFFVLLSITIISLGLLFEKNRENKKNQDALIDYTAELEAMHDDLELFKHDYLNILLSLGESIYERDIDKIERVYNETIRPTEKIICHYNSNAAKMNRIKVTEIKSLFISKIFQAERSNISIVVEITNPVIDVIIDKIDFIRICSIVLDNSIEAAGKSSKKSMYICLLQNEAELFFLVSNSYEDNVLKQEHLFDKNYTTKKDYQKEHGLGLYSLNRIIERHPTITLATDIQNSFFQQSITIKQLHHH